MKWNLNRLYRSEQIEQIVQTVQIWTSESAIQLRGVIILIICWGLCSYCNFNSTKIDWWSTGCAISSVKKLFILCGYVKWEEREVASCWKGRRKVHYGGDVWAEQAKIHSFISSISVELHSYSRVLGVHQWKEGIYLHLRNLHFSGIGQVLGGAEEVSCKGEIIQEEIAVLAKTQKGTPKGYGNKLHFWCYFRLLGRGFLKSMLRRILRLSWCPGGRVPGLINDVCNECGRGELDHVC